MGPDRKALPDLARKRDHPHGDHRFRPPSHAPGHGSPHLDDEDTFKATKSDLAWLPAADKEFGDWVMDLCGAYGWPYGPIHAFELWNEPWEGISISGWGADMLRYREIYKTMAQTIEAARKEYGVDVLIGGCGSSSNTLDKLFPDGSNEFLKWLDFCSIHYQIMAATPALMRDFIGRPNGPVRVWDTESWIANSEDRVGLVVASMHAMGRERAMGVYAGMSTNRRRSHSAEESRKPSCRPGLPRRRSERAPSLSDSAPSANSCFKMASLDLRLRRQTAGQSPDDGTVVIAGDLERLLFAQSAALPWWLGLENQARVAELRKQLDQLTCRRSRVRTKGTHCKDRGSFRAGEWQPDDIRWRRPVQLMDFFTAILFPHRNGKIVVPLNGNGYYLRTNGESGSFSKLLDELQTARIARLRISVEIILTISPLPIGKKPELRLTVTETS